MGLFNFLKKTPAVQPDVAGPYNGATVNKIYHLLFCDDIKLYKTTITLPYSYPYNILFEPESSVTDIQKICNDTAVDPRLKVLAYNRLLSAGNKPGNKDLLGVIVEVGLDEGLDVLASFSNGTARYINHTGRVIIWETGEDNKANTLKDNLFNEAKKIVAQIGPWDKSRKPFPPRGNVRISFLVSDGLYFGEGPMNVLFNDAMAAPALTAATHLMQYLTETDLSKKKK